MLSLSGESRVACCTHGDIVYEVVSHVAASGVPLDGPLEAPVASAWVLEIEDAQVVSARFVPQPPRR
jgi:hypothetical protein